MASEQRPSPDERSDQAATGATPDPADDLDTEGQSFHNYELVRAVSRERMNEAARMARDAARARDAREAKRERR